MDARGLLEQLRTFDTPTICNALEVAQGARFITGFTRQTPIAAFPKLPAIVGFARTVQIRCSEPYEGAARKQKLLGYYDYVAQPNQPSISVVQDIDPLPGLGAFWGEVNTHVHFGLGCIGALTNGSMRDLDMMCPQFQCLAAMLSPSHAYVQVVDFGKPVEVFGMQVKDGDLIHADFHGAVIIPPESLAKLPAAIDLMARREKFILDAARHAGFNMAALREALAASEQVK
ncbi:MAG: RraA family protein [Betaproteobacteria bacterium]